MANSGNYKLVLDATIDTKGVQVQIQNELARLTNKVKIGFDYDKSSLEKVQSQIQQILESGGKIKKIKLFEGQTEDGTKDISKSVITYTNAAGQAVVATEKLNSEISVTSQRTIDARTGMESFTSSMGKSIETSVRYALSIGMIYNAINQIKEGIQYVKDLNKEMTNIQVLQVDGAKSNAEIAQLAVNFNDLAKSMGATTVEVAQGSVEWLRQGKTIAETQELLKSTLMLSKLGALDTAEATDYLTSTLNSYKLGAQDASSVVDKLIAVD